MVAPSARLCATPPHLHPLQAMSAQQVWLRMCRNLLHVHREHAEHGLLKATALLMAAAAGDNTGGHPPLPARAAHAVAHVACTCWVGGGRRCTQLPLRQRACCACVKRLHPNCKRAHPGSSCPAHRPAPAAEGVRACVEAANACLAQQQYDEAAELLEKVGPTCWRWAPLPAGRGIATVTGRPPPHATSRTASRPHPSDHHEPT